MADNQSTYSIYLRDGHKVVVSAERWETDGFAHVLLDGNVKRAWFSYADVSFVMRGPADVARQ